MKRVLFLLAIYCVIRTPILAQDPVLGIPPFGSIENSQVDAINRQNLNVNFSAHVVSVPGRGRDFSFSIVNDSLVWKRYGNSWTPVVDANGNPTWGWRKDAPIGKLQFASSIAWCEIGEIIDFTTWYGNFVFVDGGGTRHPFNVSYYEDATDCGFPTGPRTGYATDTSGIYLDGEAQEVKIPDGIEIAGSALTDTNGNYLSMIVVSSTETHWKDTTAELP